MNKRQFLAAALSSAAVAASPEVLARKAVPSAAGPSLLTVTGASINANRGPLDPALDQMMHKQKIQFDKAHVFDFAAINSMPSQTIKPVLEYDAKQHKLSGPLLTDVIAAATTQISPGSVFLLRAIDGYAVAVSLDEARKYRFIIATHLDGKPMPLGGLGPLWAMYEPEQFTEMATKPLADRFARCPWGLYHIEVKSA